MALTVINDGEYVAESGQDFDFDFGFVPTVGSLIFVQVTRDQLADDIETPIGWTLIESMAHGTARTSLFWKTAEIGETQINTFESSTGGKWMGGVLEITGHNKSSPINVFDSDTDLTGTDNAPISPEITTLIENSLIIAGFGNNDYKTPMTVDVALTERWNITTTSGGSVGGGGGTVPQSIIDDVGPYTHGLNANAEWYAYSIAIAPPGIGASVTFFSTAADNALLDKEGNEVIDTVSWEVYAGWDETLWTTPEETGSATAIASGSITLDCPNSLLEAGAPVTVFIKSDITNAKKPYYRTVD